jgi:hypothetical protein
MFGNRTCNGAVPRGVPTTPRGSDMRGILLWLVGIPIPIIILLYLFNVL